MTRVATKTGAWVQSRPQHWGESRLGRHANIYAGGTPDRGNASYWEGGTIPWINSGSVNQATIVEPSALITSAALAGSSTRWARNGALVLALAGQGRTKGMAAQLAIRATCNQSMAVIDVDQDVLTDRFLYWWLASNYQNIRSMAGGDLRDGLNLVHVADIPILLPSLGEQVQIAEYLDLETGKIDALIAKQEQLVVTLGERLDATWFESVAKLQATWPELPVRRAISSIVDGPFGSSLTSAHYADSGARVVRLGNIGINQFKNSDEVFVTLEYARALSAHSVHPRDVLVAGLGDEKMPLGRATVVPDDLGPAIVKADCYRVRPADGVTSEYLAWILSSPQLREQFRELARGSTRQRLNTTVVREARIPMPNAETQLVAVRQFQKSSEAMKALTDSALAMVATLRERRQALISAASTGKIDVRGL